MVSGVTGLVTDVLSPNPRPPVPLPGSLPFCGLLWASPCSGPAWEPPNSATNSGLLGEGILPVIFLFLILWRIQK